MRETNRSETAALTKSILNEVIEGVAIAVVRELVVGGGEFLEALRGDSGEVSGELSVLGEDHGPTRHEAVDQRLLAHSDSRKTLGQMADEMDIYTVFLRITVKYENVKKIKGKRMVFKLERERETCERRKREDAGTTVLYFLESGDTRFCYLLKIKYTLLLFCM